MRRIKAWQIIVIFVAGLLLGLSLVLFLSPSRERFTYTPSSNVSDVSVEVEHVYIVGFDSVLELVPSEYHKLVRDEVSKYLNNIYDGDTTRKYYVSYVSTSKGGVLANIDVGKFAHYVCKISQNKNNGKYTVYITERSK